MDQGLERTDIGCNDSDLVVKTVMMHTFFEKNYKKNEIKKGL